MSKYMYTYNLYVSQRPVLVRYILYSHRTRDEAVHFSNFANTQRASGQKFHLNDTRAKTTILRCRPKLMRIILAAIELERFIDDPEVGRNTFLHILSIIHVHVLSKIITFSIQIDYNQITLLRTIYIFLYFFIILQCLIYIILYSQFHRNPFTFVAIHSNI